MMNLDDVIKSKCYNLATLGNPLLLDKAFKEIEYLRSLKPTIPKFVIDWMDSQPKTLILSDYVSMWESEEMPRDVGEWFDEKDIVIVLANKEQFGYFVEGDE